MQSRSFRDRTSRRSPSSSNRSSANVIGLWVASLPHSGPVERSAEYSWTLLLSLLAQAVRGRTEVISCILIDLLVLSQSIPQYCMLSAPTDTLPHISFTEQPLAAVVDSFIPAGGLNSDVSIGGEAGSITHCVMKKTRIRCLNKHPDPNTRAHRWMLRPKSWIPPDASRPPSLSDRHWVNPKSSNKLQNKLQHEKRVSSILRLVDSLAIHFGTRWVALASFRYDHLSIQST